MAQGATDKVTLSIRTTYLNPLPQIVSAQMVCEPNTKGRTQIIVC